MQRTLVLDLDGTLVNSVPDLAAALNRLMAARAPAPVRRRAAVTRMVGDGARVLVERAFAARGQAPDEAALALSWKTTPPTPRCETRAFPGVAATLRTLVGGGLAAGGVHQQAGGAGAHVCWRRWGSTGFSPRSAAATAFRCASPIRRHCWRRSRRPAARRRGR